ncbi:transcription factor MYB1R1 isoform X2 [Raphanus sativus]|uniref:Transcription factor MYB1R1 isoform X2 n=1 Tax=Raphanus sativus TaxID=3726 RepID=A0A6J0MKK2_RAPSA|nr:transcription factor MYB1R1 isoform X2 [Raphanus sativus]
MADGTNTFACGVSKVIMLFGFRVVLDPMRKSVSLNNLSEYENTEVTLKIVGEDGDGQDKNKTSSCYASADDAVPVSSNRERKRVPWTEEEHKLFLLGLEKVGKGNWKGISKNFVKSRTSTQVASHAQKYFLRRSNLNRRRRRRSSLFDMTTATVLPLEEVQENTSQPSSLVPDVNSFTSHPVMQIFPEFPAPPSGDNASGQFSSSNLINLVPFTFQARPTPISLNLSLASSTLNEPSSISRHSAFNTIGVA